MIFIIYGFINNKYGVKTKLLFTDTDSLCLEVQPKMFTKIYMTTKKCFDLSDVKEEFNGNTNKKLLESLSPEYCNSVITGVIGLRSKMYSVKLDRMEKKKKAKVLSVLSRKI